MIIFDHHEFQKLNCIIFLFFLPGRTGRAGRTGEAITLYTEDDSDYLRSIANVMKISGCEVPEWMLQMKPLRYDCAPFIHLGSVEHYFANVFMIMTHDHHWIFLFSSSLHWSSFSCSRKDKQKLSQHAPERDDIATVAKIDRMKGARNKKKMMAKVGYTDEDQRRTLAAGPEDDNEDDAPKPAKRSKVAAVKGKAGVKAGKKQKYFGKPKQPKASS